MDTATAQQITDLVCQPNRQMMDAIRILRNETALGLINAKTYLETFAQGGKETLFNSLCKDFVKDKRDLLKVAQIEHRRLALYIEQLEQEIHDEEEDQFIGKKLQDG